MRMMASLYMVALLGMAALNATSVRAEVPEERRATSASVTFDLGPFKPVVTLWDKFEVGIFYTLTSPELKGLNASGYDVPGAMCNYLHLLELRDIEHEEFNQIRTLQGMASASGKLTAVRQVMKSDDRWYYLKLEDPEGAEFEVAEEMFPDVADAKAGDSVDIMYMELPDASGRRVVSGFKHEPDDLETFALMLNSQVCY